MANAYLSDELAMASLALEPYTGFAATRGNLMNSQTGTGAFQTMSRMFHRVPRRTKGLRPVLPIGWYVTNTNVETVKDPGSYTVRAALEDLSTGSIVQQYTFSGNVAGVFNGGDVAVADDWAGYVEPGWYALRLHVSWPNGWCFKTDFPRMIGEGFASGTTTPDLTMGGAVTAATTLNIPALGLIGEINQRSFLLTGDSWCAGDNKDNLPADATGDAGILARMVGSHSGYANVGRASTRASQFTAANAPRRIALAQYATDFINNGGLNDCLALVAAETTAAEYARITALFPAGLRCWQATIGPAITGTGPFVAIDGSDQTVNATATPIIQALNALIRSGRYGTNGVNSMGLSGGYIDVAQAIELYPGVGKYKPGMADNDGFHPNPFGFRQIGFSSPGVERLRAQV